jgi:hypothetical protein
VVIAWCVWNKAKPFVAKGCVPIFNSLVLKMVSNKMLETKECKKSENNFVPHTLILPVLLEDKQNVKVKADSKMKSLAKAARLELKVVLLRGGPRRRSFKPAARSSVPASHRARLATSQTKALQT